MPDQPPAQQPASPAVGVGAWGSLIFLLAINLLNYIDRYVLAGVLPLIEQEFAGISKEKLGTLAPAFLVVYLLVSPLFGYLGDRHPRKILIGVGVQLWSLATAGAGLARSFATLFISRMLVGVGEAAYGTTAPTLISDLFPKSSRGRALAFFYVAIPVGSALGYLLGGMLGASFSWRVAFFAVGLPGLAVGLAAYFMREPVRGASEGVEEAQLQRYLERRLHAGDYLRLLKTPSLLLNTLGMTAYTFAIGGISFWMPTYLHQQRRQPLAQANFRFGLVTVVTGILGTLGGGWLADRLSRRLSGAYFIVCGLGMLLAAPCFYLALTSASPAVYWAALFFAELLLFLNTGPSNTVLVNVTAPRLRTTAFAANIFVIHALGDAISPVLIGRVADRADLAAAFTMLTGVVVLGGLLWLGGTPFLGRDTARVVEQMRATEDTCPP